MSNHEYWMKEALIQADLGMQKGELPIGAVVVADDTEIISRSYATDCEQGNRTCHAETNALMSCSVEKARDSRLSIYTTLEPCVMCTAAILIENVDEIIYALDAPADGGLFILEDSKIRKRCFDAPIPDVQGGILKKEALELFRFYARQKGNSAGQEKFVREIIAGNS